MCRIALMGLCMLFAVPVMGQQNAPAVVDLKGAVALALKQSPAVLSVERAADASSARVSAAKSAAGPKLYIGSDYGYINKETVFNGTPILENNTLINRLVLEQPVYTGGRLKSVVAQARYEQQAASESMMTARDAVTVRVAEAYYGARMAREGVDAARESVNSLQVSYDTAVKLRDAGLVTKSDVLRADVELASARERLLSAENGYQNALAALKTAMGLDQSAELLLADDDPADSGNFDFGKIEPTERHDVAVMKATVAASAAGIKAARGARLPQVFLQADAQNIAEGAFFPRQKNTATIGVGVRMPIWDSGAARAAVDEARSVHDQALEDLRATEQAAQYDLQSARLDVATARGRIGATASQVASAQESLRVLQVGYKEGATPLTDVLAAQSALVAARFNRIATNYDLQVAQVRLLKALGRTDLLQQ